MAPQSRNDYYPFIGDGASPGKIFIGGLAKDTTFPQFNEYFGKYGEIIDSVIMKDRYTGHPRGFGFITYADPSVVDKLIEEDHVVNGKQVEIKRTIPRGYSQSKDFKTKKIFVGGIPTSFTEDEFRSFFSKYGSVIEHQIIRDHATNRSRGFGFIIFESEEVVEEILSKGNMIDMDGSQVEIKKAEPKKASNPPPAPAYGSKSRDRSYGDSFGEYRGSYRGFDRGFGPGPYRTHGGLGGRFNGGYRYGPYGSATNEFFGDFGDFGDFGRSSLGGYQGESSLGYSGHFGYVDGFGRSYGGNGVGSYGQGDDGYGSYVGTGYGGSYESGPAANFGRASGIYGRGGYSSTNRYNPYAR